MSKQVQVNLAFNADTAKAKQQINDLVNSLNKIATKDSQIFDDRELREAAIAAKDLQKHLEAAVNVNTGKLDLNKFSQSLSQSKQSLQDLYNSLSKAGPQGQQAFLQLASSIASSESQVLNLSAKVKDLGQTLKNTVKWQLSSSLVHGFMGAMSQAIGYAKDLNSSLNDIRIVTGASVDEMARFAEQANKSAKALSATTTEYTKASLIYYQQGLSDQQVKERTDVTIKMANVSKTSAETVSDQMTAIWNNFYDGSKSLEYYADVMTALGAATASSTDEIAGGLEKFAAIGDTIGLSYEYAASALATITSNTRESEEVVGTALKTIFARIQGLSLGETLDDGTNLNKYSKALQTVGISIFDQAGELKRMDNILDELGNKWGTLSKDQQTALAQTVAGVRQYTQLIALMDNWNNGDSDSFQANLSTAYGASGALEEQQEIYAESWEAAADRVKAATEDIYDSLINDEAIVILLNGLEKILNVTGALIDGFGGLKGILLLVGGIFAKQFANEVPDIIEKLKNNFEVLTGAAQKKKEQTIQESINIVRGRLEKGKFKTGGDTLRAKSTIEESKALLELEKVRNRLSDAQQQNILKSIEEKKASQDLQAALLDETAAIKKKFSQSKKQLSTDKKEDKIDTIKSRIDDLQYLEGEKERALDIRQKKSSDLTSQDEVFIKAYEKREKLRNLVTDSVELMSGFELDLNTTTVTQGIDILTEKLKNLHLQQQQYIQVTEEFQGQLDSFDFSIDIISNTDDVKKQQQEIENLNNSMVNYAQRLKNIEGLGIDAWNVDELSSKLSKCREVMETFGATSEEIAQEMNNIFKEWSSSVGTEVFQDLIGDGKKAEIQIGEIADSIQDVINALQLLTPDKFKELAQEAEKTGQSLASLILQQQKAGNIPSKPIEFNPPMELSTALTTVAGLGMEAVSIFSSLGGVISVCFDEGASAGEKFIAVLSAMPAILFSIADIMKTVKSGDFISAISTMGTSMTALAGKLPNIFGKVGASAVKMGTDVAASGAAAGTAAGGFSALGGGLLALLPYIAAVVLAIGALVGIIALIDWATVTPEEQLAAAEEKAKALSTALVEAEAEAQSLKAAFDGYDSAVNKLAECTRGTQEWQSALHDVNGEVLALMERYPELATMTNKAGESAITKDVSTGALKIEDWAKEQLIQNAEQAISNVRAASIQANQEVREAEINVQRSNLGKEINSKTGTVATKVTEYQGEETEQDVSHQVSSYIAKNAEKFQSMTIDEQKADLSKYFEQNNITGDVDAWVSAIGETNGSITTLIGAIDANTAATQIENQAIIDSAMADSKIVQDSAYTNRIIGETVTGEEYEAEVAAQRAALEADGWGTKGISKMDGANAEAQKIFAEYAKAAGITNYDLTDTTGTDANRNFIYTDADGKEITVSLNRMLDVVANQKAQEKIQIDAEGLANELQQFEISDKEQKTLAEGLLNSDLGVLTEEQKAQVQESGDIKDILTEDTYKAMEGAFNVLYGTDGPDKLREWLDSLNEQIADWKPELFDTDSWQEGYKAEKEALEGVEMGDIISAEDYAALGEAAKGYFVELADGTYRMIEDGNKVREIAEQAQRDSLEQGIDDAKTGLNSVESSMQNQTGLKIGLDTWTKVAEEGTMAEQYQDDYIRSVNEAFGTNYTTVQEAAAAVREYQSTVDEGSSTLATMATSVTDLNNMLLNGSINSEQYQMGLKELGASYANSQDEAQAYTNALKSENEATIKAAYDTLELATSAGELGEEYGYTGEEIESMAKQLKSQKKDLNTTGRAFSEMAKDQLRFNDALESSKENMKDWKKSLKAFKETGELIPTEQIEEMRDAYGNLLDIDGSSLSEEFLTSTENLERMEKALAGDEKAYQELQALAGEQILQSVGIDTSKYQTDLETLQGMAINGEEWASIEAGASLNNEGFLNALTEMVNASGMTAQQATDYLSSMGVDAEVVEGDPVVTTEKGPVSVNTDVNMIEKEGTMPVPNGDGTFTQEPVTYSFPEVTYTKGEQIEYEKETKGTGLKVISANKSSGGNIKSSGSSSSSSSGGGGGGGKKSEKKKVDKVKKSAVVKRYKRVDDKIDDKSNAAEKASRAMDKMYGNSRIKQMQKYNQLLQEEIGLLQSKKAEAEDYLKIDEKDLQSTLDEALSQAGLGEMNFEIDSDGLITNYEEIMTALWAELDKQIATANANGGADDATQEKIDELQAKIDAVTEAIDQYDETRELIEDIENDMAEKALELYDSQLEALSYEIELNLEISDDSLALIEFQLSQIEDNAFKAAEAIGLMGNQAATIEEKMAKTKDALASLTAMTLDGEYTEEQMELIKQYRDELMDLAQQYAELRKQVEEQVMASFEAWREEIDRGISTIEHSGSVLESYKNITDLLGDSISESVQNNLYSKFGQSMISNAVDNIEATRVAYAGIQEAQAKAQAEYENAIARGDEASAEMWKNTIASLNEEAEAAQEAMLSSWEEALSAVAEIFEENVERAVNAFREQFDDLSDKFSRQKETSDMFLDDYQQIYELSKLSRDINKTIDDTESLGGKKKLKGLLEDINKLQEDGVEMSQYDLEYLQKTYDLRLAELELENAQNAKNTVRLSKDNEGNWSYVYTTNTDAVDQAQQKYEDALYAMQDLSSNYIDEMSEKLITTSQEMADALAALRVEDFASYQDYQDAVDAVTQEYQTKLELQETELNKAIENNSILYETDWQNYSDKTDYKISKTSEFVTSFRDSLLGSLLDSTTQSSNFMDILAQSSQVLVSALGENGKEYFENIGAVMEAAGTSTDMFGEDATTAINATTDASKQAGESVKTMAGEMVDSFKTVTDSVTTWQKTYSEKITQALEDTEDLVLMINRLNESLVGGDGIPQGVSVTTGTENNTETDSDTTTTTTPEEEQSNTTTTTTSEKVTTDFYGNNDITDDIIKQLIDMDLNEFNEETLSHALSETLANVKIEEYESLVDYMAAIDDIQTQYAEALEKIVTGQPEEEQYAGQWEKFVEYFRENNTEVLGEFVPETLLPTLTEVVEKISANAQQMSFGVGQWTAQLIKDEFMQTLQQEVSIMAEFPNVNDHNEIETALSNLINTASQYANRTL